MADERRAIPRRILSGPPAPLRRRRRGSKRAPTGYRGRPRPDPVGSVARRPRCGMADPTTRPEPRSWPASPAHVADVAGPRV